MGFGPAMPNSPTKGGGVSKTRNPTNKNPDQGQVKVSTKPSDKKKGSGKMNDKPKQGQAGKGSSSDPPRKSTGAEVALDPHAAAFVFKPRS